MEDTPIAVLVMPEWRRSNVSGILESLGFGVLSVASCQEARNLLQTVPPVEVVIADENLADGNWCDVFDCLLETDQRASVIVTAPQADEHLWSEALWRGAYDLLVEPYERREVVRIIEGALRASRVPTSGASTFESRSAAAAAH